MKDFYFIWAYVLDITLRLSTSELNLLLAAAKMRTGNRGKTG